MATPVSEIENGNMRGMDAALRSCLDVYLAVWNEGLTNDRQGSQAVRDLSATPTGPGGAWPDRYAGNPRALAVKLIRQQAGLCVAVGNLVEIASSEPAAEADVAMAFEPLSIMVRGVIEYGARAFWLLEPGTSIEARCARFLLMELTSLYEMRSYSEGRGDTAAQTQAEEAFTNLRASAVSMFATLSLRGRPRDWQIDGESAISATRLIGRWMSTAGAGTISDRLYSLLSIRAHPQGFAGTPGFGQRAGQLVHSIAFDEVLRFGGMALAAMYVSLTLVTTYHGYDSSIVSQWREELGQLPHVFND